MFEVGFSELLLIMGLALLVLGPEKLPKVVGEIGRWMGRARAMARQFREQLEEESLENTRRRQERDTAAATPSSASTAAPAAAATDANSADATAATDTYTANPEPPPFMDATETPSQTEVPPQDERRA